MVVVWLALVAVGLLGLVNLLFTTGVIRRLREIESMLRARVEDDPRVALAPGTVVEAVECHAMDGTELAADDFAEGDWAFFSGSCAACERVLPSYAASIKVQSGRTRTTVLVSFPEDRLATVIHDLGVEGMRIVLEDPHGPAQEAFGVTGFPAFIRTESGRVTRSGYVPLASQG